MHTLLQTFLAELLVHHHYDLKHPILTFFLHLMLPPLGLVHALNEFALLQTGSKFHIIKLNLNMMFFFQ